MIPMVIRDRYSWRAVHPDAEDVFLSANATYDTYSNAMSSRSIGATVKGTFSQSISRTVSAKSTNTVLIGGGSLKLGKWM